MPSEHTVTIDLGARSYPVRIGPGILEDGAWLTSFLGTGAVVVVTDENVAPPYLAILTQALEAAQIHSLVLPPGEGQKSMDTLSRLHGYLSEIGAQRDCTLVALGGGVIGDLVGFAAATWMRGVKFVQIPTTLLAQVDSSVGGKTAVNIPAGKNLVGAFHQPEAVLVDLATLKTLAPRELRAGLAEVIKYGLIRDPEFLGWLQNHMASLLALDAEALGFAVARSVEHKAQVVAADEREAGQRALLNLGHTFGHAIEAKAGYGEVLHGEAVAIGMVCAAHLSAALDLLEPAAVEPVVNLLTAAGLPVSLPQDLDPETLLAAMRLDKKNRAGRLRLILLEKLGRAVIRDDVPTDPIRQTMIWSQAGR
ncbi:MAG: 3-dehydroquinate synthase [Pseudomonadota bacterium]